MVVWRPVTHRLRVAFASLLAACASANEDTAVGAMSLVAEVRAGSESQGPEYQFTSLNYVAVHGDNVYVAQRSTNDIRVFGHDGVYRRTIGREGQGPGEFASIWSMGIAGDSLWLIDVNLRRMTLFTPAGALISTIPFDPVPDNLGRGLLFLPYPDVLMREGDFLGLGRGSGSSLDGGEITANPLLRMTPGGRTADTLGWVSVRNDALIFRSARSRSFRTQPFTDSPLTAYAAASRRAYVIERWCATSDDAAVVKVTALDAKGDTAWVRALPYTPVRLNRAKVDSVLAAFDRVEGARYGPDEIRRALYAPVFRTPVTSVVADDRGALWIRWDEGTRPGSYTVLGGDGRVTATANVPAGIRLRWVSDSTAWGEELDENDVPTLVRFRIARPAR